MNSQRGFGWVHVILIVGAIAIVSAIGWWIQSSVTSYGEAKYKAGREAERVVWQQRETEELAAANEMIVGLNEKVRSLEAKNADDVNHAAMELHNKLKEKEDEKERALADAHAGRGFGLRWTPSVAAAGQTAGRGEGAATGTAAAGAAGDAACGLPPAVTDDLIRLASDANEVVEERNALLVIAQKDREVCGQ